MSIITLLLIFVLLGIIFVGLLVVQLLSKKTVGQEELQLTEAELKKDFNENLKTFSENFAKDARENREEMAKNIQAVSQSIHSQVNEQGIGQLKQISELSKKNEDAMERLRSAVDIKLDSIQKGNEKKLEEMRNTVDEKLESTLNKRLGESFQLVTERLEQVHKSLGEMQTLSGNLTDIKKIFANVKTRGVWGEVQLGNILEEILTPEQYEENAAVGSKREDRVEFAIRLPAGENHQDIVYLPIDAKFPAEDYQRLLEAEDNGDIVAIEQCRKSLERALKSCAKTIHDKYINPPKTLEYAIMFLPTEGLYSEALRLSDFMNYTQEQCQVMVAGPTNLAALLNSIKMGFRTLAIQEKSGEIRKILGAVKTDMTKFVQVLERVQKKIDEADKALGDATKRTQIITKKLKNIEELPQGETEAILEESLNEE